MALTQKQLVMRHLEDFGELTSWDAFREYGITRLSACIFNLRDDGVKIKSKDTACVNRYGRRVHYTTYILEED